MVKTFFATLVKWSELALYLFSSFIYSPSLIDWPTNWLFCANCKLLYVELDYVVDTESNSVNVKLGRQLPSITIRLVFLLFNILLF